MIIQTLSEVFVGPRLASERVHTISAATLVDRAAAATTTVNVSDFIESLPLRYDMPVGENGALISSGQVPAGAAVCRSRGGARVLMLDECTPALDTANQAAVMRTL